MELIPPVFLEDSRLIENRKYFIKAFSVPVYWYVNILDHDPFTYDIDYDKLIQDIKNNDAFFIFDHSQDPINQRIIKDLSTLTSVINFFEKHDLPKERLIILGSVPESLFFLDITPSLVTVNPKKELEKEFNYIFWPYLIYDWRFWLKRLPNISYDYPEKHFLSLARRDSINRRFLNYSYHKHDLFDKGLISHLRISENNIEKTGQDHEVEIHMLKDRPDFDVGHYIKYGFMKHSLDGDDLSKGYSSHFTNAYDDLVERVCFEVVTETDVNNTLFLTEKTLKPLYSGIPFLISGPPYILKYLKKLGFKTYDSIFDESYDVQEVYYDRVEIILRNLKKLCNMRLDDCKKLMDTVRHIGLHNQNHFMSSSWTFNINSTIQNKINEILNV